MEKARRDPQTQAYDISFIRKTLYEQGTFGDSGKFGARLFEVVTGTGLAATGFPARDCCNYLLTYCSMRLVPLNSQSPSPSVSYHLFNRMLHCQGSDSEREQLTNRLEAFSGHANITNERWCCGGEVWVDLVSGYVSSVQSKLMTIMLSPPVIERADIRNSFTYV